MLETANELAFIRAANGRQEYFLPLWPRALVLAGRVTVTEPGQADRRSTSKYRHWLAEHAARAQSEAWGGPAGGCCSEA